MTKVEMSSTAHVVAQKWNIFCDQIEGFRPPLTDHQQSVLIWIADCSSFTDPAVIMVNVPKTRRTYCQSMLNGQFMNDS